MRIDQGYALSAHDHMGLGGLHSNPADCKVCCSGKPKCKVQRAVGWQLASARGSKAGSISAVIWL